MSWPCSRISSSPWAGRGSDWPAATATGNLHPLLEDLFLEGIYWFKVLLEVSLIVPDFTLSVYGSSCHSLFVRLILILFSSFSSYFLASHSALGMPINRKRRQRSENEAEFFFLYELLYTEMSKSKTIRLTSALTSFKFSWLL